MEKFMHNLSKNQPSQLKKQAGATLMGMLFISALLFFVALIGMKLFPAYQEYFEVKGVIRAMNKESLSGKSNIEIQKDFDRRASAGYLTVIKGTDITIEKNSSGQPAVSAQYQVVTPLFGNMSVLMDFNATADGK